MLNKRKRALIFIFSALLIIANSHSFSQKGPKVFISVDMEGIA